MKFALNYIPQEPDESAIARRLRPFRKRWPLAAAIEREGKIHKYNGTNEINVRREASVSRLVPPAGRFTDWRESNAGRFD